MSPRITPRRTAALAAFAAAAAFAVPATANAAVTGDGASLTSDDAADTIVIGNAVVGFLTHNRTDPGFDNNTDFNSTPVVITQIPVGGTLTINGNGGNDTVTAAASGMTADNALTVSGGAGDDIITGGPRQDAISGGADDDRLTGGPNPGTVETINGEAGNDTIIWNNGDGNDVNEGGDGARDVTLITNGAADDQMKVSALPNGRFFFERTNALFNVDFGTERLEITSFAGADRLETLPGVTVPIKIDAGPGEDIIATGDAADIIEGGEDVDTLNGGAGGDRISGDVGNDVMNGNAGDDVLVWNNGDGTDDMNGDDGLDRIENNLGAANDVSQVKVDAGKIRYDRVDPAPFGLNIASSEVLELNTFGGNDTLDVAAGVGGLIAIVADAGAGNDAFRGGDEADTFFGGLGDDTLSGGTGSDTVDGQDGTDRLEIRDGVADLARGGAGADTAVVDALDAVAADVETVEREAAAADKKAPTVALLTKKAKVKKGSLSLRFRCPADETRCKVSLRLLFGTKVYGRATTTIAGGKSKTVKVKLTKAALKRLRQRGRLSLKVAITATDAAGNVKKSSPRLTANR